jgi:hypothetical protein
MLLHTWIARCATAQAYDDKLAALIDNVTR